MLQISCFFFPFFSCLPLKTFKMHISTSAGWNIQHPTTRISQSVELLQQQDKNILLGRLHTLFHQVQWILRKNQSHIKGLAVRRKNHSQIKQWIILNIIMKVRNIKNKIVLSLCRRVKKLKSVESVFSPFVLKQNILKWSWLYKKLSTSILI